MISCRQPGRVLYLAVMLILLPLAGCMGWGDVFSPKHSISGDYYLMQGEDGEAVYLMVKGRSGSVTGPIHQIGWNGQYIVFTDDNWPNRWNVIQILNHQSYRVSEEQRRADQTLRSIALLSPKAAWKAKASG
jgi:hypothetical protein